MRRMCRWKCSWKQACRVFFLQPTLRSFVTRQLVRHSHFQKETLLLAAGIYCNVRYRSSSSRRFQFVFTWSFLAYCALLGALLGRTRRVEQEFARAQSLGDAEFDARRSSKIVRADPHSWQSDWSQHHCHCDSRSHVVLAFRVSPVMRSPKDSGAAWINGSCFR